jgi:hypothetical protein
VILLTSAFWAARITGVKPLAVKGFFEIESLELFAWMVWNQDPPDLCLLSSYDCRCEPPVPSLFHFCNCFV